jgi:glycosyltransferase involved in cell wall biosynthesis
VSSVSVVTCAYTEDRWDDLVAAVESVRAQTVRPLEAILVIDHNESLLQRARARFPDLMVEPNTRTRGASGARNTAAGLARGEIVAFLDDDARATETWLEELLRPFADPDVAGVGGVAAPLWATGRPQWFPEEFDWIVGCSYRGLPTTTTTVRNVIGTNMSVRRELMIQIGGFREGFGNVAGDEGGEIRAPRLSTGEETEFCIRLQVRCPQARWVYSTSAKVLHRVPLYRQSYAFFLSRCWIEGIGKASLAQVAGAPSALSSERAYTLRVLPEGVRRGAMDAARGDLSGLLRAGTIVLGFAVTSTAYVVARVRHAWSR